VDGRGSKLMSWRRFFPHRSPPWWQGQLLALLCVGVATDIRWLAEPLLASDFPFVTFFPATLIATIWGGRKAGVTSTVLGALIAAWLFMPRRYILAVSLPIAFSLTLFLLFTIGLVLLTNHLVVTSQKATRHEEQLEIVTQELRHRIKNILTVVDALVSQTARGATSVEDFQSSFRPRLAALQSAQNLLVETPDRVILRTLIEEALKPFALGPRFASPLDGPRVDVSPEQAVALALILNELATNATKYGALSVPNGRIDLGWTLAPNDELHLHWREIGGPAVTPPAKTGFGSRLFELRFFPSPGQASEPDAS
jgi:two-component sensor histidine kinase